MGQYVYRGRKISLNVKECTLPSGKRATYEIIEHTGSVAILPLIDSDTAIILKQYRPALGEYIYEIPAGTLKAGEDPHECARRELEEETGYRPGKLVKLFEMYMAPGYSREKLRSFVATDLKPGIFRPSEREEIEVVKIPLDKAIEMIETNEIRDAKTIATIFYYTKFGRRYQT